MLERLARTMYRRRRRVLVAWIVALIGAFMLSGVHRRRVPHRVQAARHREPGGLRPAPEFELPRPPGTGADRLRVRPRGHRSRGAERHGGSLRRDPAEDPERHRREPLLARGATPDRPEQPERRLRGDQLRRPLERAVPGRRQGDQSARRPDRRARVWRSTTAATCSPPTRSTASPRASGFSPR